MSGFEETVILFSVQEARPISSKTVLLLFQASVLLTELLSATRSKTAGKEQTNPLDTERKYGF
jgi:hypothetical protein